MKTKSENLDVESAYRMIMEGETEEKPEIELKFSDNLATEFANTINLFTKVCEKMVQNTAVDKDTFTRFDDLLAKIKNLADAARNSVH